MLVNGGKFRLNALVHLSWSLTIPLLFSFVHPIGVKDIAFSLAFGFGVDADHLYYLIQYHEAHLLTDWKTVGDYLMEISKTAVRYHTVLHELLGTGFVAILSIVISVQISPVTANISFISYVVHVVMDALSIRMVPLSPLSKKEIHIGLIEPGSARERSFAFASLGFLLLLCLAASVIRLG